MGAEPALRRPRVRFDPGVEVVSGVAMVAFAPGTDEAWEAI